MRKKAFFIVAFLACALSIVAQSSVVLEELKGKTISVSANFADNLTTAQWYVMFDRGTQPK